MALHIIILAAGKGKRTACALPKVMQRVGGITLLEHVVACAQRLNPKNIHVVYGNGGNTIRDAFPTMPVNWVFQKEQLGTGHAVLQAIPQCDDDDDVLVLYGDVPLITADTLHKLLENTPKKGVGVLVAFFENPTGFGRIIRDSNHKFIGIVEEKDANESQKSIHEINTGIIAAPAALLKDCLPRLGNDNAQKEYYLTDVIAMAVQDGLPINGVKVKNVAEVRGVNDLWQLATVERYYQHQQARAFCLSGVIVMDPSRLDVRGKVSIGSGTQLDINVLLENNVDIGEGCYIGPNVVIKNSVLGNNVTVLANTVIDGAVIENDCQVGPFARIRPDSVIKKGAHVGNFVEIKKTILGEGSKASHLTYLGDAVIGKAVNIGAGTITCNYDGVNKWTTQIDDEAFIGSHTSLVAPVTIGYKSTIAAGSVITKNTPEEQLTIARAKQTSLDWSRPVKKHSDDNVDLMT